jgi:uncharacterized protein (TIGR00290 family)
VGPNPKPRAIFSWSSGKDSAFALERVFRRDELEVVSLITSITDAFGRVAMHGVPERLVELQAQAIDLPLEKVRLPYPCSNEIYEAEMATLLRSWRSRGVTHVIFGDLYLEDIRRYREEQLRNLGLEPSFPLWLEDTRALARAIVQEGFRALVTCGDPKKIPSSFVGRAFDESLLKELPESVDPCGENGEFHTFVYDGPIFGHPIPIEVRGSVVRDGFVFADIVLSPSQTGSVS